MKYGVRLRGENFEMIFEDEERNFGFFTTRFVRASTPEEAEIKAVELVKSDKQLIDALLKDRRCDPMIYLEEIWEERWWRRIGGKGYTFFPMEAEDL